jgi:conjugative transfer region protein TrbK
MNTKTLDRIPTFVAVVLLFLAVTACAIRLRGDEDQTSTPASAAATSDTLTTKLSECRSGTYEQKDALPDCRKAWAEERRQFLGQKAPTSSDSGTPRAGPSLFVTPKDESRLPSGDPSIQQTGKE